MQLMPGTAKNPGFGVKGTSNPWDPQENMRVGREYLNAMLKRYGGDKEAALIAYNAGPGNADKWVASGRSYDALPKRSETEPYVRKILGGGASPYLASALQSAGVAPGTAAAPTGGPMPVQLPTAPTGRHNKLADALLASAAGAKPQGWGDLLNAAGDLALGYSMSNKQEEAEKSYRSKLAEALMGAKDPDALTNTLLASGDPQLQQSAVSLKVAGMKPQKPEIGRFKVENGVVVDSVTGEIVAGKLGAGGDKPPAGYRAAQDGNLEFIPGGPADPATNNRQVKYNEGQTKAANFGKMMTEAEKLIGDQANPIGFWGQLRESVAPEALNNQMRSPEYQKYRQAADQWIRAKLRKESGATITPEESEGEFRTFFPQPGDGPQVVEQKKLARQQAIEGMKAESGGAYDALFQGQPTGGAPAPAAAQPTPALPDLRSVPRPQGITDEQIKQEAFQAIRSGKDEQAVRQQLEAWGIRF